MIDVNHRLVKALLMWSLLSFILIAATHVDRAAAQIELIGIGTVPGDTWDMTSDSAGTAKSIGGVVTDHRRFAGISAVDYSGTGNQYYMIPDRGPAEGRTAWHCRLFVATIDIDPGSQSPVQVKLQSTHILADSTGRPFTGMAEVLEPTGGIAGRFDPEGLRVVPGGSVFLSDEYGPLLIEFSTLGKEIRRFEIPESWKLTTPFVSEADELANNQSGRRYNRGMEGLAISPDYQRLIGIMQSPLIQDSKCQENGKLYGMNCRLIEFDIQSGKPLRQWVYPLDHEKNRLSEILAVNDHQFLVIERDGGEGTDAKYKKITLIDVRNATDVSNVTNLPAENLPTEIRAVEKSVLIDLLDSRFELADERMPAKFESLTFGPRLEDGRLALIVVSDNDFNPETESMFYVFGVDDRLMVGNVKE